MTRAASTNAMACNPHTATANSRGAALSSPACAVGVTRGRSVGRGVPGNGEGVAVSDAPGNGVAEGPPAKVGIGVRVGGRVSVGRGVLEGGGVMEGGGVHVNVGLGVNVTVGGTFVKITLIE